MQKNSNDYDVVIIEKGKQVGGISKTIDYDGNKMDLGGHRFFTKDERVSNIWKELLPIQGFGSYDDLKLNSNKKYFVGGPNPEKEDKVFLIRNRGSRIYYNKKFFDYPVKLNFNTVKNLGFMETTKSGFSYLKTLFVKKEEFNLENFYINRFGKKLYSVFFEGYTEKLWGRNPKEIDSSWGAQRVKGLSIREVIKDFVCSSFKIKNNTKQVSLIDKFYYPKYGPGQMYEEMANKIKGFGGKILLNTSVVNINCKNNKINSIVVESKGKKNVIKGDIFISSMPIKDLIIAIDNVPKNVYDIAFNLPYRSFVTIGVIFDKLSIKNKTKIETLNSIIPDTWIYVQSKEVKLGRIQVFNNWSPYLLKDVENTISLGLEYFCDENDDFWNLSDEELKNRALKELSEMKIIDNDSKLLNYHVERVEKAYPAYFDSYVNFDKVKKYLNKYINLYCIGRNGQHRYNNMDHSMLCGIICIDNILKGKKNKENIWNVNCDKEYHEEVKK